MTALLNQYALMLVPAGALMAPPTSTSGGTVGGGGPAITPRGGGPGMTISPQPPPPTSSTVGGGGQPPGGQPPGGQPPGGQPPGGQPPGGQPPIPVQPPPAEQTGQGEAAGGGAAAGAATKATEEPSPSFLLLAPFFPAKATPGQLLPIGLFTQYVVVSPVGSSLFAYAADVPGTVDETVAKLTGGKFSRIFALPGIPAGVVWQMPDGTLAMFLQSPIDATKSVAYSAALPAAPALPLPGLPGQQSAAGLGPFPALPAGLPMPALPAGLPAGFPFPLPFPIPGTG